MRFSLLLACVVASFGLTGCVIHDRDRGGGEFGPHGEYRGHYDRDRDYNYQSYPQQSYPQSYPHYQYYPDGTYRYVPEYQYSR